MAARRTLRNSAPVVATVVTAVTMAGVMLPQWMHPVPKIPVVTSAVPAGGKLNARDIHWISAQRVHIDSIAGGEDWARQALQPGEVLTSGMTASHAPHEARTLVEVTPTQSSNLSLQNEVGEVEVLIVHAGRILWSSGPCSVASGPVSTLGGTNSALGVWLSPKAAINYLTKEAEGTVDVIGVAP